MYHHQTCDVKTMCYIVFISHSLHWHYIKTALQEYVINGVIDQFKVLLIDRDGNEILSNFKISIVLHII